MYTKDEWGHHVPCCFQKYWFHADWWNIMFFETVDEEFNLKKDLAYLWKYAGISLTFA